MEQGWVALLRAVNLGSRNKVPMATLRQVFEEAGGEAVRTYIQSGNVVFAHAAPDPAALEEGVAEATGVSTVIVLRSAAQIRELARSHPFGEDTSRSAVAFLAAEPEPAALGSLTELDVAPDRFALVGPDVALHYPNGFQGARLSPARIEQHLGVPATARNWRTVARLAEMSSPGVP